MRRKSDRHGIDVWAGLAAVCLVLLVVSCQATEETGAAGAAGTDSAADRQAVLDAHQALVAAYQKADISDFLTMLDKSDELLIYHPRIDDRWQGIDDVQENLPSMFARLRKSTWLDVHLQIDVEGDIGWITSHIVIESENIEQPFTGRGTEIWRRRAGSWRLVHGHWSSNPEF